MSHVDNVILAFSNRENESAPQIYPVVDAINAWLQEHSGQEFGPQLGPQHHAYGGHKALETPLYVAAFNHWPEEDFMAFLRTLPWKEPDEVQIIVKRQHDNHFVILTLQPILS